MNSFESDLKRAVISVPFIAGVIIETIILFTSGFDSDLFKVSVPVAATLPYSTAWLLDYQSGFVKEYVPRCGINSYIISKILACGISGGLLETLACYIFSVFNENSGIKLNLIFSSGMLWAVVSATLAAWSKSRYIAYGGSFVIYYILVIFHDRYFESLYSIYPYEWINPEHVWVFDEQGIVILMSAITIFFALLYYCIIWRCIERV